ncbi:MAG: serine/threonine protein kinase [Deltaproteobacteria bacterium]|nr:serine/threonine protein kinase [Deltaproteobacteria bacterium]
MAKADFETSSSNLLGKDFGPYRIVRRLGVGGMAETFEAIRRGPSGFTQRVCLKLVLPFFREDEDFLMLFEREAKLVAKLRHSNIVGVIDFGEIDGTSYMALELVDGADLEVLLDAQDGKRLSHEYVALLGHELAAALEHAHNPPRDSGLDGMSVSAIVHRDISPSNVLISSHGEVLLTDFGVAKAVTGSSRKQSAVKGKIPYMSPEQLRAEAVDGRADLFALGVVLFEALAGRRPYEGSHDPATIMLILQGDHPSLHELVPGAPPELCRVIESLIQPDRDQRPANAAALIDLLDQFVPSPRVQRQLGKMTAAVRPEQVQLSDAELLGLGESDTAGLGDARSAKRKKSASGVVGAGESEHETEVDTPRPHAGHRWSRRDLTRALAGSLLAITGLAAGGFALWSAETKPAVAVEAVVEEDTRDKNIGEGAADEKRSAEPRSAKLTVVVFPRGDVWINGKASGPAPLRNESLKPGRYKISAGKGRPSETQTVDLRPGQRKTLLFDLTKRAR